MVKYAGFWLRLFAYLVDSILLVSAYYFMGILAIGTDVFFIDVSAITPIIIMWWIAGLLLSWLYFAIMESSKYKGTLGKMALEIKVTDIKGKRIGFGKASVRFFGKYLSMVIIYIGYLMIAFTKKKQGLHDIIAKTLVVKK